MLKCVVNPRFNFSAIPRTDFPNLELRVRQIGNFKLPV
jgi:hypothetical protein